MIDLSDSKLKVNEKHGKCLFIDFWTVYPRSNQDQDLVAPSANSSPDPPSPFTDSSSELSCLGRWKKGIVLDVRFIP